MPPRAFGYLRVSHLDSAMSGLSKEAQEEIIKSYFNFIQHKYTDLTWGCTCYDAAVSAYHRQLIHRPAGGKLNLLLKEGDHVIFAKVDRGFRDPLDMLNTKDLWHSRGITMHFVDMQLDCRSAMGEMLLTLLAAIARWESARKSERNREAAAIQRRNRKMTNGEAVYGTRIHGKGQDRKLIQDRTDYVVARYLRVMREYHGLSWNKISVAVEAIMAKREGRKVVLQCNLPYWQKWRCLKLYRRFFIEGHPWLDGCVKLSPPDRARP